MAGGVEGWVTERLRFGVSGLSEETGTADQTLFGADLLSTVCPRTRSCVSTSPRSEGAGVSAPPSRRMAAC